MSLHSEAWDMLDPKWLDHLKDSDTQLVATVVCLIFLGVQWATGWPPGLPWWVIPLVWIVFLFVFGSLALKFLGAWLDSREG